MDLGVGSVLFRFIVKDAAAELLWTTPSTGFEDDFRTMLLPKFGSGWNAGRVEAMTNFVQEHLGWFQYVSVGKYFFICAGKRKMDPRFVRLWLSCSDVQPSSK